MNQSDTPALSIGSPYVHSRTQSIIYTDCVRECTYGLPMHSVMKFTPRYVRIYPGVITSTRPGFGRCLGEKSLLLFFNDIFRVWLKSISGVL